MSRGGVRPSTLIRQGVTNLPADTLRWLAANEGELQKLYDGLNAQRDAAVAAMRAAEMKLAALETANAREADLAQREADLAAALVTLAEHQKVIAGAKAVLVNLVHDIDKMED